MSAFNTKWWENANHRPIDWKAIDRGLDVFFRCYQETKRLFEAAENAPSKDAPDRDLAAARSLLGVGIDATEDEIRAALRNKMANQRLHPDQGGNEECAKRVIAAQNLLIANVRRRAA